MLRHANRRGGLCFVLILPDGSKSLVPAQWTDFSSELTEPAPQADLLGTLENLLQLRTLTDALWQRATAPPLAPAVPAQESHAANFVDIPVPQRCLWENLDHAPKQLVIETLARLMLQAAVPANEPKESAHD